MRLWAMIIAACFPMLSAAAAEVAGSLSINLAQQSTPNLGGNTYYYSGNLLQNPDASSPTVTPPWTQGGGAWTVTSGPAILGSHSINSSDGSPWFLSNAGISCSGICQNTRTLTLMQKVNLSVSLVSVVTNYATHVEYGGDAFAESTATGNGPPWSRSTGYEAIYTVDFLNSSGQTLATNTSGDIFSSAFGCPAGSVVQTRYGYRRTVAAIPTTTVSIRFTATMNDRIHSCGNQPSQGSFRNGFDKLWLELVYLGGSAIQGFKPGPAPVLQ